MITKSPAIWARLGIVSLAMASLGVLAQKPEAPAPSAAQWVSVQDHSLEIVANSALDFSSFLPTFQAGRLGIAGDQFTQGGQPATLNCASLAPGFSPTPGSGFPDHDAANRYAAQLRRHGYNLVRFHYVDALLMQNADADFAVNPQQLDRFQYFLAALSRNKIRWLLDVMSSPNAALGNVRPHRWSEDHGMTWRAFVEPAAYAHWERWANWLLTQRNPYTGFALANDPHTLGLILVNEPSLTYRSFVASRGKGGFLPGLDAGYADWQKSHAANGLIEIEPASLNASASSMSRFQAYLTHVQRNVTSRMTAAIRATGYPGPVTSFDNWPMINQIPSRRDLDFIDMHGYAEDEMPVEAGRFQSPSSIANGARYLQIMATTRVLGKPMTISEHGDFFPNPNRFESGLLVPAFASLQGWNAVCQHADGAVDLAYDGLGVRKDAVYTDSVGLDPVRRVGETLTALLLLRHEIAPASGSLAIAPDDGIAMQAPTSATFGSDIGMMGWLVRLGLGQADGSRPTLTLPLADAMPGFIGRVLPTFSRQRLLDELVGINAIRPEIATLAATDIWRSSDGTTTLDLTAERIAVVTRQTSASAGGAVQKTTSLGPVQIQSSDAPGLIAVSALDEKDLRKSNRILIMMVSDAQNSGMQLSPERNRMIQRGTLPVMLRRMHVRLDMTATVGSQWKLEPLHLNGSPMAPVMLRAGSGALHIDLDTQSASGAPTTYFLLTRQ